MFQISILINITIKVCIKSTPENHVPRMVRLQWEGAEKSENLNIKIAHTPLTLPLCVQELKFIFNYSPLLFHVHCNMSMRVPSHTSVCMWVACVSGCSLLWMARVQNIGCLVSVPGKPRLAEHRDPQTRTEEGRQCSEVQRQMRPCTAAAGRQQPGLGEDRV